MSVPYYLLHETKDSGPRCIDGCARPMGVRLGRVASLRLSRYVLIASLPVARKQDVLVLTKKQRRLG